MCQMLRLREGGETDAYRGIIGRLAHVMLRRASSGLTLIVPDQVLGALAHPGVDDRVIGDAEAGVPDQAGVVEVLLQIGPGGPHRLVAYRQADPSIGQHRFLDRPPQQEYVRRIEYLPAPEPRLRLSARDLVLVDVMMKDLPHLVQVHSAQRAAHRLRDAVRQGIGMSDALPFDEFDLALAHRPLLQPRHHDVALHAARAFLRSRVR